MVDQMTPQEIRDALSEPDKIAENAFSLLKSISVLCHNDETLTEGREMVIRALEHYETFIALNGAIDVLIRQVGLFPYAEPKNLSIRDKVAYEFHRPINFDEYDSNIVFHREQAEVYRGLMDGESFVLSAPTSFGKSLIIDALLASGRFKNFVIIVPTIALIDETRRRLSRFRENYKIITHPSQAPADSNVFVLTQERAIDRDDIEQIDILVIDEFYKLDIGGRDDSDRAAILNHALYKLRKISKQIYLLGPSIRGIPDGFGERFKCYFKKTDFNTVVSEIEILSPKPSREEAFLELAGSLEEPTLVYCRSPNQANTVVGLLADSELVTGDEYLNDAAGWVGEAFHPDWSLRTAIEKGVGIHHGRIPRALAHLNVRLFNEGKLKFLVCTSSLIEGVNTAAKNVIIYEGKLASSNLDFFTFRNIQGRSGRMFQHFIGKVFVFETPPAQQLDIVDIPIFTQGADAPLGLLMQVDDEDLTEDSKERVHDIVNQDELSVDVIRQNSHLDPERQIALARRIRENARALHRLIAWRGLPEWEELRATCELIFDELIERPSSGVFSGAQLAFRLNQLRQAETVQEFIVTILDTDDRVDYADEAVEVAFMFQRQWAQFAFPRYLGAINLIQAEIFGRLGLEQGDYSYYGQQAENLFLPPELPALEEYGLPVQLALKLKNNLTLEQGLDEAITMLRRLDPAANGLTSFEIALVNDAQRAL